jgi:hypothetical protein
MLNYDVFRVSQEQIFLAEDVIHFSLKVITWNWFRGFFHSFQDEEYGFRKTGTNPKEHGVSIWIPIIDRKFFYYA